MKKMRNVARYYCGNGCNFVGYGTAKTAFYKASTPSYSAHSRNTKLGQWRSTAKEGRPCVLYSTVQNTNRDTSGDGPIRQTLSPYLHRLWRSVLDDMDLRFHSQIPSRKCPPSTALFGVTSSLLLRLAHGSPALGVGIWTTDA